MKQKFFFFFSHVGRISAYYCPELFGVSFGEADYGVHLPIVGAAEESANRLVFAILPKNSSTRDKGFPFIRPLLLKENWMLDSAVGPEYRDY